MRSAVLPQELEDHLGHLADLLYDQERWSSAKPQEREELRLLAVESVVAGIVGGRDWLYQRICVEFDYCNRKRGRNAAELAGLIADILIAAEVLAGGIPIASASLALVKWTLDKLCGCK